MSGPEQGLQNTGHWEKSRRRHVCPMPPQPEIKAADPTDLWICDFCGAKYKRKYSYDQRDNSSYYQLAVVEGGKALTVYGEPL